MTRPADASLQRSRRVDWRFLLPEPELGRVGYLGTIDPELVEACRCFGSSFVLVDVGSERSQDEGGFDTVVVVDPTPTVLEEAVGCTRAEGWLYVELCGPGRRARRLFRRRSFAPGWAARMRGLGCDQVQLHWHWPDFAACVEMIPLTSPSALRHALLVRRIAGSRFQTLLRHVLVRSRLLPFVAPWISIVARVPPAQRQPE